MLKPGQNPLFATHSGTMDSIREATRAIRSQQSWEFSRKVSTPNAEKCIAFVM
jgi:hypothetical protein